MYDSGFGSEAQQQPPPGWQPGGYADFGGFEGFEQGFTQGFGPDAFQSIFEMMNDFVKPGRGKGPKRDVQRGRDITLSKHPFFTIHRSGCQLHRSSERRNKDSDL